MVAPIDGTIFDPETETRDDGNDDDSDEAYSPRRRVRRWRHPIGDRRVRSGRGARGRVSLRRAGVLGLWRGVHLRTGRHIVLR